MIEVVLYIAVLAALGALGYVGYLYLTGQLEGGMAGSSLFGTKAEKRLDVVEYWNIDARRRLVLIRRDNVEHLIMTGGPVDVVIETGIGEQHANRSVEAPTQMTGLSRAPTRPFGRGGSSSQGSAQGTTKGPVSITQGSVAEG
jgi:flagellar protein FliO/FliZ